MQKLKNNEARPKFTGSYKNSVYFIQLYESWKDQLTALFNTNIGTSSFNDIIVYSSVLHFSFANLSHVLSRQ